MRWILPADRPGYRDVRAALEAMEVIGEGRRGWGEFILGTKGSQPDRDSPLPPVFAYGVIESDFGNISITLRDIQDNQASLEIASHAGERVPPEFEEFRRWTYSTWDPGTPCPQCGNSPREVILRVGSSGDARFVLTICPIDRRIWLYDHASRVNRLIPVTNFYNELMLHKKIRDPRTALDSKLLFRDLQQYTDEDLASAFQTYNKLKSKVSVEGSIVADRTDKEGFLRTILNRVFPRA
jgi:hypothetical protein